MSFHQCLNSNENKVKYDVVFGTVKADKIESGDDGGGGGGDLEADTIRCNEITGKDAPQVEVQSMILTENGIVFQTDPVAYASVLGSYLEHEDFIDFVQSDNLSRVIIATQIKFTRVGNVVNLTILGAGNTQTLQSNNHLVSSIEIPVEFRPINNASADFTVWIKKASENLGRDHARLLYDGSSRKLYIYDPTSNDGQWNNAQDLSMYTISISYATGNFV